MVDCQTCVNLIVGDRTGQRGPDSEGRVDESYSEGRGRKDLHNARDADSWKFFAMFRNR